MNVIYPEAVQGSRGGYDSTGSKQNSHVPGGPGTSITDYVYTGELDHLLWGHQTHAGCSTGLEQFTVCRLHTDEEGQPC